MWHRSLVLLTLVFVVACGAGRSVTQSEPGTAPADGAPANDVSVDGAPLDDVPAVVIAVAEPLPTEREDEFVSSDDMEQTVKTVERFIHAIGSNRTIRLRPGTYDFGAKPGAATAHVRWEEVYDGHELVIHDVENLTIMAASKERPKILAQPRYAFVLKLENVKNVTFENLVLGHTPAGGCTGGVVGLDDAENVTIVGSDLYGSGTVGVSLVNVKQFRFERSSIRECTYGIAYVRDSTDVVFSDSEFIDNEQYDLVDVTGSPEVRFERCAFSNNRSANGYGNVFFKIDAKSSVVLDQTSFDGNDFDQLTNQKSRLNIIGSKTAGSTIKLLSKVDPQYNEVYSLARYRKWVVAGTQAGIVFWDPSTGRVDKLVKAYISGDLMVRGKYLWAGTYTRVIRFDGLASKTYLKAHATRGGSLIAAPGGKLLVHQNKLVQQPNHWWQYDSQRDRFTALTVGGPRQTPSLLGGAIIHIYYDMLVRKNGQIWWVDSGSIVKHHRGNTTAIPSKSRAYPGTDPRRLYEDPRGRLWAIDFGSGFLRYDDTKGTFVSSSTVKTKGSDMVIDSRRRRSWFLHYTRGLYLERPGKPMKFFDLSSLQYMRTLLLDKDGSVWVGGWNALTHIEPRGAKGWRERSYLVSSKTVPVSAAP